jgi:MFS family permease
VKVLTVNRDFRLLFAAVAVSRLGTSVGYVAVPVVAVAALGATPGQVGLLATLSTVAFLLIGLPAGAWADRLRRRRVLITADLVRAALFASVPAGYALGTLTMTWLYVVVLLAGVGTVFFDVANQSYLPQVVGRPALLAANARLVSMDGINDIAGRGVAGYLLVLVAAPVAVVLDAVSYLASAVLIGRIRHREEPPERSGGTLWREVREGAGFVLAHPILRAVVISGAIGNTAFSLIMTMLPVVFVRDLGVGPGVLGLWLAVGGAGALLGSLAARRLADRLGAGRVVWLAGLVTAPLGFAVPLMDNATLWLAAGCWLLVVTKSGVDNVIKISFRQRVTPDRLLGRMNATFRFVLSGALAVGAALAGVLGELAGPRAALWAGALGIAVVWVPIACSPLRTMRDLD